MISAEGRNGFSVTETLVDANNLPVVDWNAVHQWVDGITGEAVQARAWSDCERAWLEHLRAALGPTYRLREQGTAMRTQQAKLDWPTFNRLLKRYPLPPPRLNRSIS